MTKRIATLLALVSLTFGLGLAGCKSPAEKACANLAEIASNLDIPEEAKKESADEEKCVKEFEKRAGDCKNGDEVLNCIADIEADDAEALGKGMMECTKKCEEK